MTDVTTTKAADLHERYRRVLPPFVSPLYGTPIAIDRGEGGYVWDLDGTRYLDFFGGILTTMVGHNNPSVTAAVQAQAAKVIHTSTLYLSEPMIALAEKIAALSGIPDARVFLTPSGTEANDAALLLATVHRKSNQILAMRNSYHGRTFAAQAITSHSSWSNSSYSGLQVTFVQGPYRLRSPFGSLDDEGFTNACVDDLSQLLTMTSAGDVAAMIAEPIQGVGGFATPPDGFFGAMHKELSNSGILFISDEVQTGWGRTGDNFWGYQAHGIVPDMLTFAKGVGNGLALAGVVARAEIMESITALNFSTFGGNPLSAAAGAATIDYVLDNDLQANAKARGERFRAGLDQLAARTGWIAEVRGKGLMQALETVSPGGLDPSPSHAAELLEATKDRNLLIGKGGLYGNVIRMAPMLNVTDDEIDEGLAALNDAVDAID
ncbi:MAG: aspartate aminotransferase family protein [Actinomycetota bacterium]